jgi:hypothetical protein
MANRTNNAIEITAIHQGLSTIGKKKTQQPHPPRRS